MRGELSPAEKEKLLRDMWVAHDGRWFLAVAAEFGFEAANKLNQTVLRSMGKKEARELMTRSGVEVKNASDFKAFLEMAGPLYWPEEHTYEIGDAGASTVTGHIVHCYVWENVNKGGGTSFYQCAAPLRFRAWLEGIGLRGEVIATKECSSCNGSCDISFRFDLPENAASGTE
jgi:Family of unknown function (DUF6125)